MSLDAFKVIYWWEWTHRLLARSIGVVFLLPFLFFLWRGAVPPRLRTRLWAIFGARRVSRRGRLVDGVVGPCRLGRVSVSQYRLAFHLTLATRDLCRGAVDGAADRAAAGRSMHRRALRFGAVAIAVLVLGQIYLGALVAGLDAGLVYNTWPLIDGAFIPARSRLLFLQRRHGAISSRTR